MTPAKASNYKYEGVCLAGFFKQMCTCNRPSLADDWKKILIIKKIMLFFLFVDGNI